MRVLILQKFVLVLKRNCLVQSLTAQSLQENIFSSLCLHGDNAQASLRVFISFVSLFPCIFNAASLQMLRSVNI